MTHSDDLPSLLAGPAASRALDLAASTLQIEADAILALRQRLSTPSENSRQFVAALNLLLHCKGRIVVSGMGKSGHIARKIAATLASTGSPAFFVHPGEAAHGDLGMVTAHDVFIAISNSGETAELLTIMPVIKRIGTKIIALTGKAQSNLAQLAAVHLDASVAQEACPLNLAPTASTTVTLALGDALAVALLDARGFRAEDFALSHPGGALGRRLLTHVRDVMRTGEAIPRVGVDASLTQALLEITRKGMAMTCVVNQQDQVLGIFTDGDLRRMIEKSLDFSGVKIADVMAHSPRCIGPDQLAVDAVALMEEFRINQLIVASPDGQLVGALHIHDLTRAKVI
jgi:arabinose-5-phosphate isomerase